MSIKDKVTGKAKQVAGDRGRTSRRFDARAARKRRRARRRKQLERADKRAEEKADEVADLERRT